MMRLKNETIRRHDKAIIDVEELQYILKKGRVCRLAMVDGQKPYLVPLSYGYAGETLYFHCAHKGRKIDILHKNPHVWFEITIDTAVTSAPKPCDWGVAFQCVMGEGVVEWIETEEEKSAALSVIMEQQAGGKSDKPFIFGPKALARTTVFSVAIKSISGKKAA